MDIVKCYFPDCDHLVIGEVTNSKKEKFFVCQCHYESLNKVLEKSESEWFNRIAKGNCYDLDRLNWRLG
jgi:hypothetical protein